MSKRDVSSSFRIALQAEGWANIVGFWVNPIASIAARRIAEALITSPVIYLDMSGGVSWLRDLHIRTPGHFVVVGHGSPQGMLTSDGSSHVTAQWLGAQILAHRAYRRGKPVLLLSCMVGAGSFAQDLSDVLQADVVATPDLATAFGMTKTPDTNVWRARWYCFSPDRVIGMRYRPGTLQKGALAGRSARA